MHARTPLQRYVSLVTAIALSAWPLPSHGACSIAPTAGNDTFTCDSASSPGFSDLGGNNQLLFPSGNGTITGNVTLGAGNDLLQLDATGARLNGSVSMGDGANVLRLNSGTVTGAVTQGAGADTVQINGGNAGPISQGAGIDSFSMSAGTIAALAQGDGHDQFLMSGGTISGAFEDGDTALMTGGRIGRVDMKLDNNLFDMRGGTIIGNLVTGFGNDTVRVSGASLIGGNLSTSGGTDTITVTGGTVNGQILASTGADTFNWIDGGQISAAILMGPDNDLAALKNLNETLLAFTPLMDGGSGIDTLTFDNTQATTPGRYANWEQVALNNTTTFTLGGAFVLGDAGTGSGTLAINNGSTLRVTNGLISAFSTGEAVSVSNSGLIDMATGSTLATDTLTINGNYTGNAGLLALQSVLGSDDSPSDKLLVSQGTLQGATLIRISNLGGTGAATLQDGIQVVQATHGATGSGSAFSLAGRVSAGAYDYYLFKGGVTAGTAQSYYLRSTLPVAPPVIDSPLPEPVIDSPVPEPVSGTPALPPNPAVAPLALYRPEVPIYAALYPAAQQLVQGMLGTYHQRLGEQHTAAVPAGWGRVYGGSSRQTFAGTVSPTLDSSITGFQVGSDVYASQRQRSGFFIGHSTLKGDVKGFNGGWQNQHAGRTTLRGDSLGVYWTLLGANRAYLDLVLMGTRFDGSSRSAPGIQLQTRGHNLLASAEVGWPFALSQRWELEPQAQLIVDRTQFDSRNDGIADVAFSADSNLVTRLGVRLRGGYRVRGLPLQPYGRADVWHAKGGTNTVTFNDVTAIDTEQRSTTLGLNLGTTLQVARGVNLYGEVGYKRNLDSQALNGHDATLGVRVAF